MLLLLVFAATTGGTDWVTPILSAGGPFAVVTMLWVADKIGNNSERNALRQQNKDLVADLREVREAMSTGVIPLMTRSNDLIERQGRIVERTLALLERKEGAP